MLLVGTNRASNNRSNFHPRVTTVSGRKGEGLHVDCRLVQANKKKKGLSVNTQSTRSKTYWSIWRMRTSTWRRMITGSTCILLMREIVR